MRTRTHDTLSKFEQARHALEAEKQRLEERLTEINAVLPQNGLARPASVVRRRRPRSTPLNQPSLRSLVLDVTKRRPLSKAEILAAVKARGYRFKTMDELNSLNALIYKKDSGFRRTSDGKFGPA